MVVGRPVLRSLSGTPLAQWELTSLLFISLFGPPGCLEAVSLCQGTKPFFGHVEDRSLVQGVLGCTSN